MALSKTYLSGSTLGKGILVVATATAGTLLHTTAAKEELSIYCVNSSSTAVKLTIEFGGATAPDQNIEVTVPGEAGPICVVPGFLLGTALTVKAFAGTGNVLVCYGQAVTGY